MQAATFSTSEEELINGLIIEDTESMEDTEMKLLANKQRSLSTSVTNDFKAPTDYAALEIAANPAMSIIPRTQREKVLEFAKVMLCHVIKSC